MAVVINAIYSPILGPWAKYAKEMRKATKALAVFNSSSSVAVEPFVFRVIHPLLQLLPRVEFSRSTGRRRMSVLGSQLQPLSGETPTRLNVPAMRRTRVSNVPYTAIAQTEPIEDGAFSALAHAISKRLYLDSGIGTSVTGF